MSWGDWTHPCPFVFDDGEWCDEPAPDDETYCEQHRRHHD